MNVPGVHSVEINAYRDGCESNTISNQSITVLGPASKIRYATDCSNRLNVFAFHDPLMDVVTAITLNFGESPTSTISLLGSAGGQVTGTVAHIYTTSGNYTATLSSENVVNLCPISNNTIIVKSKTTQCSNLVQFTQCFCIL